MADTPKPVPPKTAPESIKTDPAQPQRLATEGDTSRPAPSEPVDRQNLAGNKASVSQLLGNAPAPEGAAVKQQDAAGNFIADERDKETIQARQAEARRLADSGTPQQLNASSGTPATAESLQHDQLIMQVKSKGSEPDPDQVSAASPIRAVAPRLRTSAISARIKEKEAQLRAIEDGNDTRARTSKALLQAQISELKEHEAKAVSGAPILMPRSQLLEAPTAVDQNPDSHLRWVNEQAPGRADAAIGMGYRKLGYEEGGRQVGELALYAVNRETHATRVVNREEVMKAMMDKHRQDVKQTAEEVIRYLRDTHGIKVKERDILINEGGE
jgi:hypothetical protein